MNRYFAAPVRKFGHILQYIGDQVVVRSQPRSSGLPYPVTGVTRPVTPANPLPGHGPETFDQADYTAINQARLAHLASLRLSLAHKTVIDVGCGVGHLAQFFVEQGCRVVCIDGRAENIATLRRQYPNLVAQVVNVETESLAELGVFDIVFAYGLLYHLENPLLALRNMASACRELLLLETQICDHILPIVRIQAEPAAASQALLGLGCRPSPSYVALALKQVGFPFVYGPKTPPQHPEFQFEWKNNLDWRRNGYPMRCVFIASRTGLQNPNLINLLEA